MGGAEQTGTGTSILRLALKIEIWRNPVKIGTHNGRELYRRDDIILPPIWIQRDLHKLLYSPEKEGN